MKLYRFNRIVIINQIQMRKMCLNTNKLYSGLVTLLVIFSPNWFDCTIPISSLEMTQRYSFIQSSSARNGVSDGVSSTRSDSEKWLSLHAMAEASTRIAIVDGEKVNEMTNFLCFSLNHADVIYNVENIVLLWRLVSFAWK